MEEIIKLELRKIFNEAKMKIGQISSHFFTEQQVVGGRNAVMELLCLWTREVALSRLASEMSKLSANNQIQNKL